MAVALITGGSAGLGLALVRSYLDGGWTVVTDGRDGARLEASYADRLGASAVVTVAGDVSDDRHRLALAVEVERLGRLDLLVHNASTLGPLPMRTLRDVTDDELAQVWQVNAAAPLALTRLLLPRLVASGGSLVAITSDAAVEHYGTWGAYAATKTALEHLVLTTGVEEGVSTYAVDPGDLRTAMHQAAFPGEDISDRPLPHDVVPRLRRLLDARPPSGRYRVSDELVEA